MRAHTNAGPARSAASRPKTATAIALAAAGLGLAACVATPDDEARARALSPTAAAASALDGDGDAPSAGGAASKASSGGAAGPTSRPERAWTMLVYMAADNEDLPPYAFATLHQMEAAFAEPRIEAASNDNADVVVQLDLPAPPGLLRIHVLPSGQVDPDLRCGAARGCALTDVTSRVIDRDLDETSAPGEILRRFLTWGVSAYPARRYLVVVWGHGLGFLPAALAPRAGVGAAGMTGTTGTTGTTDAASAAGAADADRHLRGGIAWDESQRVVIDTPTLRDALAAASRDALAGRPFDVYASDACLMQSIEVASELTAVARYVVGSEQIEGYLGLPYRTIVPRLNGTGPAPPPAPRCPRDDEACAVAAMLPALDLDARRPAGLYASEDAEARAATTLATIDAEALDAVLLPAIASLAASLLAYVDEDDLRRLDLQLLLATPSSPSAPGTAGTPSFPGGGRDLGIFLTRLDAVVAEGSRSEASARLRDAITAARVALDASVIASASGERYAREPALAGVSLWLPRDAADLARRIDFFGASRLYARAPALRRALLRIFA
jgi:Clostripain family